MVMTLKHTLMSVYNVLNQKSRENAGVQLHFSVKGKGMVLRNCRNPEELQCFWGL